jgi:hypothetical protein
MKTKKTILAKVKHRRVVTKVWVGERTEEMLVKKYKILFRYQE